VKTKISYEGLDLELKLLFESGVTTYAKCSEVIRSKYSMGADRFTKQYKESHAEWANKKKETHDKVVSDKDEDRLKKAIITKERALQVLSEIAEGKEREVKGNIIVPSPKDQCAAIETVARIEGWVINKSEVKVNKIGIEAEDEKYI